VGTATRDGGATDGEQLDRCEQCDKRIEAPDPCYRLRSGEGWRLTCRRCAVTYGPLLRRSLRIAGIIGSVLLIINHGDTILGGQLHASLAWKIPATYAVPFLVATWSGLSNTRVR
jgi:hypothetical protein